MKQQSLTSRTIGGLIWVSSGALAHAVLSMLVMIVQARLLSPTEFGIVGAAMIVIGFSQIFSQLGIGPAIVQRTDLTLLHLRVGFTVSMLLGVLVGVVFFFSAPYLARFFQMAALQSVVEVLSLVFPITGLSIVGQALLQRSMHFKKLALIDLFSYALGFGVIGIGLALAGWGVWALVGAQIGQVLCSTVIILVLHPETIGIRYERTAMSQLVNYGFGFSLARIANYTATQADNLVVGKWMGPAALGVYGRAYQFLMMPATQIGTVADKVLFPAMAAVQDDQVRLSRAYVTGVAVIAMTTLPLSGLLIVLAPEIIRVLLGPKWMAVVPPFQVLAAVLLFRTSYKMSDSLSRSTGAVYRRAWRQWIYAGAVFGGAWIGHLWSLAGVAWGVGMAILLNFFLMLHLTASIVTINWRELAMIHLRHFVVACVVSIAAGLVKLALHALNLPAMVILIGALGAAFLVLLCLWMACRQLFGAEGLWAEELMKRYGRGMLQRMGSGNAGA